jgi:hypothetical protein
MARVAEIPFAISFSDHICEQILKRPPFGGQRPPLP